jgi:hypothetical protein
MVRSNLNVGVFSSVGDSHFWRFIPGCRVVCGQLFCTNHLAVQHCAKESYFLHLTNGGMLCHQQTQKIIIPIVIFVRESQKWKFVLHELCISTCVYWVALVAYCHVSWVVICF